MEFDLNWDSVMVVGGGTSTLDVLWEAVEYESLWTCNDFYLEQRLLDVPVSVYMLGFMTDLKDGRLLDKLNQDKPFVFYEPTYYRGKERTPEFQEFMKRLEVPVHSMSIPFPDISGTSFGPMQKSGAVFRLILLAYLLQTPKIYFVGFDGFNRDFSNKHAFTKHVGLKPTDTRRTYEGTEESYVNVFTKAYQYLGQLPNASNTFQNLGEGFDYNIGTPISKTYFPLSEEITKIIDVVE